MTYSSSGFNTISLSVDDGQVEFTAMRNYAKTAVRTGQDASDGNFHEVSIVREGKKITLNMDGSVELNVDAYLLFKILITIYRYCWMLYYLEFSFY